MKCRRSMCQSVPPEAIQYILKKKKNRTLSLKCLLSLDCTETSRQRGKQGEINELPLISLIDAGANYWPDEM